MYPTIQTNHLGVAVRDKKFKLGYEIREALIKGQIVFLVKRRKRVDKDKPG